MKYDISSIPHLVRPQGLWSSATGPLSDVVATGIIYMGERDAS